MNVYLFGGSNSIVKGGLNAGWPDDSSVINAAIRASSSIQNLYALLCVRDSIESDDIIVSESNVNESFNVNVHGDASLPTILENIDSYYFELDAVECHKVVVLMPFRNYLDRQESSDIVNAVNGRHLDNANKYGLYLLNLSDVFSAVPEKDLKYIMADARHPLQAIMFNVAKNIGEYFISKNAVSSGLSQKVRHGESSESYHSHLVVSDLDIDGLSRG